MPDRTALSELIASFSRRPESVIAHAASGPLSGADFLRQIQAWQQTFAAAGGNCFAMHLDDSVVFAAALLGAWSAGKTVFLPADTLPATVESLRSQVDGFVGAFPDSLQPATAQPAGSLECNPLDPDTVRLVLYTSGSSGDPVAISKNLRQLDSEVAALESRFGERLGNAVVHGTVSHQHIYGLLFRVLWPLSTGRKFAASRLGYPEQIAAALASEPTILIASPALLKRIPESLDWSPARAVFCSGGPLPAEAAGVVRRLWQQPVVEVFGSTETGGIASRADSGAAWQVLPGVEFRIEQGLLQVRSPHLAQSDWYETQDRARETGSGFELLGRADRLVKLEERRISLSAIERKLQAEPSIEQVHVLMLPRGRARMAAVAVLTDAGRELHDSLGRKELVERLRSSLRGQVDAIAIPRLWRFVAAMPVNAQGKTPESLLATLFQSTEPGLRWLERGPDAAKLAFTAEDDLAVFDGHFPLSPIVPGVALVDWAIRWGRDVFAIERAFLRMDAMKFQRVVTPGTELDVSLNWHAEKGALNFRFESVHGAHALGRVLFAAADVPA